MIRNFGGITNCQLNFKAITDHDCIFDTPIMNHGPVSDPVTDHEKKLYYPVLCEAECDFDLIDVCETWSFNFNFITKTI